MQTLYYVNMLYISYGTLYIIYLNSRRYSIYYYNNTKNSFFAFLCRNQICTHIPTLHNISVYFFSPHRFEI